MRYIFTILLALNLLFALNHLANEPSPYLQQHKNNPVNWYPWGKKAFKKAKSKNRLIFLSIGYSTCHWCHVMAKESFSNKEVAKILNRYYVSIKVDKEEYPQIDEYYQNIYTIFNQSGGGWPLTIILTPNKKPVFAATYLPKYELIKVLKYFASLDKAKLESEGKKVLNAYKSYMQSNQIPLKLSKNLIKKALNGYYRYYDKRYFGFGRGAKFPQSYNLDTLLTIYQLTNSQKALDMVINTLDIMASSGLYDQIDGGFFRYTIDRKWQKPHFEKMLYTNAALIEVYTKAYKLTNKKLYKSVVINSVNMIDKFFKKDGLYLSASNADSPNYKGIEEEGFYYLFDYDDVYNYLQKRGFSKESIKADLSYLSISEDGNFNGVLSHAQINREVNPDKNLKKIIKALQEYRKRKEFPFIDYKINTAWNAMYIKALIEARYIDKRYLNEGLNSLDKLIKLMIRGDNIYHQRVANKKATKEGVLEDYAFVSDALFSAYEATLDKRYFKLYSKVLHRAVKSFYKGGKWYLSKDRFALATLDDKSYKSPLAVLLKNLYIYGIIKADINLQNIVKDSIESYGGVLNSSPQYLSSALKVALMLQNEVIILKSNKKSLLEKELNINYPFIYRFVEDTNRYLACNKSSCFSFSKDFKKVKMDILMKIKKNKNKSK